MNPAFQKNSQPLGFVLQTQGGGPDSLGIGTQDLTDYNFTNPPIVSLCPINIPDVGANVIANVTALSTTQLTIVTRDSTNSNVGPYDVHVWLCPIE